MQITFYKLQACGASCLSEGVLPESSIQSAPEALSSSWHLHFKAALDWWAERTQPCMFTPDWIHEYMYFIMQNFSSQPADMSSAYSQHAASFMSTRVLSLECPINIFFPPKSHYYFTVLWLKVYAEFLLYLIGKYFSYFYI